MSCRLIPDRPGYSVYECDGSVEPYVVSCMCCNCSSSPDCSDEYLNIPTSMRSAKTGMPWNAEHSTYISRYSDTEQDRWTCTDPDDSVTPRTCGDDVGEPYHYLRTDYIDVPPVRVRGVSIAYRSPAKAPCKTCYDIEWDDPISMTISGVWIRKSTGSDQQVLPDEYGMYPDTLMRVMDLELSAHTHTTCSTANLQSFGDETLLTFCDPPRSLMGDPDCGGWPLDYIMDNNGHYNLAFSPEGITGYAETGKFGLIIEDGCLKWLEMEKCATGGEDDSDA